MKRFYDEWTRVTGELKQGLKKARTAKKDFHSCARCTWSTKINKKKIYCPFSKCLHTGEVKGGQTL